ncbi:MAG TPA: hypothetical protein GXZ91_04585 [Christensenellaceae bacterium]|nr:hypothetical protein [Christensenellaceae bacterium]
MKKKDIIIIISILVLVGGLILLSKFIPSRGINTPVVQTSGEAQNTPVVDNNNVTENPPDSTPVPTLVPADAYLKVQIGPIVYEPYPLIKDNDELVLKQRSGKENVVRMTRDSIWMHFSNCDNQDCVHQGTVTLENRDMRVLQNMIICLPNQVVLELQTKEEAEQEFNEFYN